MHKLRDIMHCTVFDSSFARLFLLSSLDGSARRLNVPSFRALIMVFRDYGISFIDYGAKTNLSSFSRNGTYLSTVCLRSVSVAVVIAAVF